MKVIQLHERYRFRGGEDAMVDTAVDLLKRRGIDVRLVTRDSRKLETNLPARVKAFGSGIYSFSSAKAMKKLIARERPDIVHVHNLHPQFSPSVLVACHQLGVPVVMTCHQYRLVCPSGMHMRAGKICELCLNGKEYWCFLINCKSHLFQSMGYALRNAVHRKLHLFEHNITLFITASRFVKSRLTHAGFPKERMVVLPNMVKEVNSVIDSSKGKYVAFAGRFSPQKGIETLLEAAHHTKLPLQLAGDYSPMNHLIENAPKGTKFMGSLSPLQMVRLYRNARFVVVPSECLEPFGLVAAEAMSHGLPVIASKIGGLEEIIEDKVTGLLFDPGNAIELANKMKLLWNNPKLCQRLGKAAREKVIQDYNEDVYFERLIEIYNNAIEIRKRNIYK